MTLKSENKRTKRAFFYWLSFAWRHDHSQWGEMLKDLILGPAVVFAGLVILVWAILRLLFEPALIFIRPFYYAVYRVADLEFLDRILNKK